MELSRSLPSGVVTFLLTDIQGSTRLWEREAEAMASALARHDSIVATCVRRSRGYVVKSKGEGDSLFAVFSHARDAVAAALVIQLALRAERWPTSIPIQVRIALHTGRVDLRDGDYFGPTVNRCARLRSQATGGQVLLSSATAQLVQAHLPTGATLSDLGLRTLKDLSAPERVFALRHPQLDHRRTETKTEAHGGREHEQQQEQEQEQEQEHRTPSGETAVLPPLEGTRLFRLVDHTDRDAEGRQLGAGARLADAERGMRCYSTPGVAALLNSVYERFRFPRLWEVLADEDVQHTSAIAVCHSLRVIRQVPLPTVTPEDFARFAVLSVRAALEGRRQPRAFAAWSDMWLGHMDSSGVNARAVADALESEAHAGGSGLVRPDLDMTASAARAAMHAARTTWAAGRARDEEHAQAMRTAGEAVHTALRMASLDLLAIARQALPGPRTLTLPALGSRVHQNRILTALPT